MELHGRKRSRARGTLLFLRYYPERVLIVALLVCTFLTSFYYSNRLEGMSIVDDTLLVSGDGETCTFTGSVTSAHTKTINPGSTQSGIGSTKITTKCTNSIEHKVYAIGYSNNTDGNTNLINSADNVTIATGTATSGDVSNWAMLIAKDTSSYEPSNLTITNSFGSYHAVPSTATQVSGYTGATDSSVGSSITTTYRTKLSSFQVAGTYVGKVKYTMAATMFYSAVIKTATGISKVTLNGVECTSTSGCTVTNLTEGESYNLVATLETGYNFGSWSTPTNGTIASASSASTTFTVGGGDDTITPSATAKVYTITLNGNGATTAGSPSTTVTYKGTTLGAITRPSRAYTISGFTLPASNNADGAQVSSTSQLTSNYTFNGWYKETGATSLIASNAATPVLSSSTSYTNGSGQWTYDGARTLYAGWTAEQKILPTITKTGFECGWTETATNATSATWQTGDPLTPNRNYTLYGVCVAKDYTVTISAGAGVSSIELSGWTGTGTSTLTKTFHYGDTIDLSAATLTYKTGYNGADYVRNETYGSLSGSTYTVGDGNGNISIHAGGLDTPTCEISGGTTKVFNNGSVTLTAASVSSSYDTNSANIRYSFGYASSADAALGNFSAQQTGNTYAVQANSYRSSRYYGVTITVTDKNRTSITSTCTSTTGTETGGRTAVTFVNSRINFNATANGGTLNGSTPRYVYYNGTAVYSGRTNTTAASFPTATPPTGYTFDGWYTAQTGGSKVLDSNGQPTGTAVSGWTDSSNPQKWLRTSTSTSSTANRLWAHYSPIPYTIALTADDSTYAGSTSTTVTYGNNTVGTTLDLPKKEYTISGFTLPASNKASGATVSSNSALTYAWTLVGWTDQYYMFMDNSQRTVAAYGTMYLNPDGTLSANQTCTDENGNWNCEGSNDTELDAKFAINSSFSLPSITKEGYNCGWTETATNATTIQYHSTDIYPEANKTLYGVCKGISAQISLNQNGATTNGSTTAWSTYGDTILHGSNPATGAPDSTITNPQRKYTISGFTLPSSNGASGAQVSSTSQLTSTYTFNGWYQEAAATHKIASNAGNPALLASTAYTNASSEWTSQTAQTLYAGWTPEQKTLPSITKPGHQCGWTETATNATSITYQSGDPLTPNKNYTLYGVCIPINYTVTVTASTGINTLTLSGWTGSGTGTLSKTYHYGDTIDLSTFVADRLTGFTGSAYTKNDSYGSLSGSTYTVGEGDGSITIKASGLATPTCEIAGGTTKVYNRSNTTLTATDTSGTYESNSVNITYSFGYATSTSGALGSFTTPATGNTTSVSKSAFRGTRYYGVTVVATSVDDSSLTSTCTSTTGTGTGGRTGMVHVNSRVQLNDNGGTITGTKYFYVYYNGPSANKYTTRTGTTAYTLPTVTPPQDYVLDGWYTAAEGGNKVMNADFSLTGAAVSGWSNTSSQWVKTGTSDTSTATANQLYAHYTFNGTYIQNLSSASCTSTPMRVYDSRDMQAYYVKRLEDGNCWMMENLNLGATDLTVDLTSTNSNLSTDVTAATFNGWKKTTGTNSMTTGEFMVVSGTDATSGGKYGTLYNYHALTGGYVTGATTTYGTMYDICPAGWRLPTGGTYGEYDMLTRNTAYDTVSELRTPYSSGGFGLAFAGYTGVGAQIYIDQIGTYWTSTRVNTTNEYYMSVNSSMISPTYSITRGYMQSARCVMKRTQHLVTVSWDSNIDSVMFNGVNVMNGWGVYVDDGGYYQISAVAKSGYRFGSYSTTVGSFVSSTTASTQFLAGTAAGTITVTSAADTYNCTKRYHLQNADGSYPDSWYSDGVETISSGSTCSYSKSVTNYQTQSDSVTVTNSDVVISLELPRNTYLLNILRYSSISSVPVSAMYRWGEEVQLSATPNLAEGYRFYQWAHYNSANEGTFSSTTIPNAVYTMPIGEATIVASGRKNYFQEALYSYCGYPMWDYRTGTMYGTAVILNACFMTQNLELPAGTTLDSTYSNVSSSYTLPSSNSNMSTGLYVTGNSDCSTGACSTYYNYTVATAGTAPTMGLAEYDICPKYWRLITTYDYDRIATYNNNNSVTMTTGPFQAQLAGNISTTGVLSGNNSSGLYWTGGNSYLGPSYGTARNLFNAVGYGKSELPKGYGASVRCMLQLTSTLSSSTYMQSVNTHAVINTANGATGTLVDSRPITGTTTISYGYIKATNTLWMTSNLRLPGGSTLTTGNSNVGASNNTTTAMIYGDIYSDSGLYYNHVAATANARNTTTTTNAQQLNLPRYSVCPKYWRLPTYPELSPLVSSFGTQMINLLNLTKNGVVSNGSLNSSGTIGGWWTATTVSNNPDGAYTMMYNYQNSLLMGNANKGVGYNIRCIYDT